MKLKHYSGAKVKEVGEGKVQCVFATLNVIDKDGDVTLPGAFGEQLAKIAPAHDWRSVPLGKAAISEVGAEALADLSFNMDLPIARDWHSAIKFDAADGKPLQEYSYGFDVLDASYGKFNNQDVRFLKKMKVFEVSPVMLGAGENTRTLAVKGRKLDDQVKEIGDALEDLRARILDLKTKRGGDGRDISKERQAELDELCKCIKEISVIGEELAAIAGADVKNTTAQGRKLLTEFLKIQASLPR